MSRLSDFFWPRLEPESEEEEKIREESHNKAIDKIKQADWELVGEVLEEARALYLRDEFRIKSAETKAAIYLSALAAMVSLSVALIQNFFSISHFPEIPQLVFVVCIFLIFSVAIAYSFNAGIWAFRTIKVRMYYRVDVEHLTNLNHKNTSVTLCKDILQAVRSNRDIINEKIDCMQMAHEFIIRMFVCYFILLVTLGLITIATAGLGFSEEPQQSLPTPTETELHEPMEISD